MNWMIAVGVLFSVVGTVILIRELREATDFLSKKIPARWKKWRLIPERSSTWVFYLVLIVVLSASFLVLWRVYS